MEAKAIIALLQDYPQEDVKKYANYCVKLTYQKKRDGGLANPWAKKRQPKDFADYYKRVAKDGLVIDGQHITLQSTGITYDYIAYKNKMFLQYPESTVDTGLVKEGDQFTLEKDSGKVSYTHLSGDPFGNPKVIGAYCVIKNKRGEFITTLSKADIDKHRKVAKQDYIWKQWYDEMALKTVIKKACKQHFADVYQNIESNDNDNYELENPVSLSLDYKSEIDAIQSLDKLKDYYNENRGKGKDFDKYISIRKNQLKNENS